MFRSLIPASVIGAACLLAPAPAPAAKVKVWHHYTAAHHDKARLRHAVLSNEGTLRLSRQLKPLAAIDATHVWDVVEDKHGNLFVATGDEGKLYRISPDGEVRVAYTSPDCQILCLALAADGTVYAGTGPSGLVVCIPPKGKTRVLAEDLGSYVWSLAFDEETKTLFAGTGPKGRVYQVTPDGKASVFYATRQEHILCLALGAQGTLYAGTDKGGLVYRIDRKGKGFVVYNAPQGEVRSLLVTPAGVYAGTSAPSRRGGGDGGSSASSGDSNFSTLPAGATSRLGKHEKGEKQSASGSKGAKSKVIRASNKSKESSSETDSSEESKDSPASAAPAPSAGENSLYRIAPDGTVRELFREKALVLCLMRQAGRVLVGTGMHGQLFEIDEATKERVEIARLDHGQIHCLCRRRDGSVVLGTGDPGKLYVLQDRYASKGTVVSDVLDAKIISKWGALSWKAHTPAGTRVTVAVRSGNVAEPDDTWSDWSAEQTDPETARVTTPPARFLQYRVTMATDNPHVTPAVKAVAVRYMTTNQPPEVTGIEVPDLDTANLDRPRKLKLKWTAVDPNEDELTYSLYVRKEGWKNWVQIEEELSKREYEWDTSAMPSGVYQVKVVASDHRENAPEDALTAERVSAPFPVSQTPPTVTVRVTGIEGDRAVVEATATDPLVRLTEASFAVNGKKWSPVFPADGLFDSRTEQFRFKTGPLRPGTHVLVLRVRDAAGNVGSGDVVFSVQPRKGAR
jgi:outer membrane protein assembly factor BamB